MYERPLCLRHTAYGPGFQSIAPLESELGLTIFIRARSGSIPTKEGLEIIKKGFEVVNKLEEMKEGALRLSEFMNAELRVAAIPGVMNSLVQTVSSFRSEYQNISFRIVEGVSEDILHKLRLNELDIGLIGIRGDVSSIGPGILFEPIWDGRIVVGAWRTSPLAAKKKVTPEEMRKHSFALYDEAPVMDFVREFAMAHGPLILQFTSNNQNAIAWP